MIDWSTFTLFIYILMRMSGFILFNPVFGRRNIPEIFKAGLILVMTISVQSVYSGSIAVPNSILEFSLRLLLEFGLGFLIAMAMHFFFYIAEMAGFMIDEQMGLSMAKTYDAGSQASMTTTATLLNLLMLLLFFAANGHQTLFRLMLTSGNIVPFGKVSFGENVANWLIELFIECSLLAVKVCLPILAAELMGQIGMGILMKVIPQINVFSMNIELKIIIGLVMIFLLIAPFSEFLLKIESSMFTELERALALSV